MAKHVCVSEARRRGDRGSQSLAGKHLAPAEGVRRLCGARDGGLPSSAVRDARLPPAWTGNLARLRVLASAPVAKPAITRSLLRPPCGGVDALVGAEPGRRASGLAPPDPAAGSPGGSLIDRPLVAVAHRCDGNDCEKDEPALHRGYLGIASCDENKGTMRKTVVKEHCRGDCVDQHEAQHVTDLSHCCKLFASGINNAGDVGGRNVCRERWLAYDQAMESFSECNAYTREDQCLTEQLQSCGFPDKDPDAEACCQDLVTQQNIVRAQMKTYCPGVPGICPFP
jgi:hypothetical protein